MKFSVIVPTYRRPHDLKRCLQALQQQIRPANEVIVIVRDTDIDTWACLQAFGTNSLPLKVLTVIVPGVVAAMNLGVEAAHGDILAFTDDDAAPHPDWLQKVEAHFLADDLVGGVGGRDVLQNPALWDLGTRESVGLLSWFGRVKGEHHRGIGAARRVDVLKGVNMCFRRSAVGTLRFDDRLLGAGAQVHFEIAFCLTLKRQGWNLIYDPAILVDHHTAPRFDEDQRHNFNSIALSNAIHNETLALLDYFSPYQRIIFLIWAIGLGTTQAFGVVQWLRYLPSQKILATQKWFASMRGRHQGVLTWLKSRNSSPLRSDALATLHRE